MMAKVSEFYKKLDEELKEEFRELERLDRPDIFLFPGYIRKIGGSNYIKVDPQFAEKVENMEFYVVIIPYHSVTKMINFEKAKVICI